MKKHLLFITIPFVISFSTYSQSLKHGVKLSLFQNRLSDGTPSEPSVYSPEYNRHYDPALGVFVEKKINNWFTFQPGATLSIKSTSFVVYESPKIIESSLLAYNMYSTNYRFTYLELPVLGKFTPFNRWNVYIGPTIGYAITRSIKTTILTDYYLYPEGYPLGREIHTMNLDEKELLRYELGYQLGIGYEYRKIELTAGYESNFTSIYKDKKAWAYKTPPKFHSPSLSLSYRF